MDQRMEKIRLRAHQLWEEAGRPSGQELAHWTAAEQEIDGIESSGSSSDADPANEGEGNRTAACKYNKETRDFAASGKVAPKALEAARALDGKEAADLKHAEEAGKSHSHGEDPLLQKADH